MCLVGLDERTHRRPGNHRPKPCPGRSSGRPRHPPARRGVRRPDGRCEGTPRLLRDLRREPARQGLPGHGGRRLRDQSRPGQLGVGPEDARRAPTTGASPIAASTSRQSTGCGRRWSSTGPRSSSTSRTGKGLYGPESKADLKRLAEVLRGAGPALQPERRLLRRDPGDRPPAGQETGSPGTSRTRRTTGSRSPIRAPTASSSRRSTRASRRSTRRRRSLLGGMYGYPRDSKSMKADEVPQEALQGQGHRASTSTRSTSIPTAPASATSRKQVEQTPLGRPQGGRPQRRTSRRRARLGLERVRRGASRSSARRARRSGSATG